MSSKSSFARAGMIFLFAVALGLRADLVEMRNGDRYVGRVLSVDTNTVAVQSAVLGKINLPRTNVASLTFGPDAAAPAPPPAAPSLADFVKTNAELAAALRSPGTNAASLTQIREQMLGGNPEAIGKFNELLGGLMTGKLNVEDIRREAKSAADQLREYRRELGPEAGGTFDGYLKVLDRFLNEADAAPTNQPAQPATR